MILFKQMLDRIEFCGIYEIPTVLVRDICIDKFVVEHGQIY